jgi:hypothetical protein
MIWACHWQLTTLYNWSMIVFTCGLLVVTCSWFGFNAIIVTYLFELTFEFASTPINEDNKLRLWVTCQPGVMKQILDGCCSLIRGFNNFKPTSVDFWIYHFDCKQIIREFVLAGVLIVNGPTRSTQTMTQGFWVKFCYFRWDQPMFLTLLLCYFTLLISSKI